MAGYRVFGEHVVSEAEVRARAGELADLADRPAGIEFSGAKSLTEFSGAKSLTELSGAKSLTELSDAPAGEFAPIGKGLPLTVMLREVYTGRYPKSGVFGGRKDVAVVSGVKNFEVFNASARALNFIMQDVRAKARASGPTAFSEGTPLVAYSPAVLTDEQILTVEFAVDSFPAEFIAKVGGALSGLAGIPLLLPYAGILLGAGEVVKLAAGLGDALFDGRPSFSVTHALPFDVPGSPIVKAAFRILCADSFDASQYSYRDGAGLVDANGRRYEGDEPYVVISLDGREHSELASFTPTVASAAVLQRFFHMRDGGTAAIDTLMEGLKLVSDMRYRQKAEALQKKVADTPAGPAKDKLQAELDAILKNIGNDLLKPKA